MKIKDLKSNGKTKGMTTTPLFLESLMEKVAGKSLVEAANARLITELQGVKKFTLKYPDGQTFTRIGALIDGRKVYLSKRLEAELAENTDNMGDWTFRQGVSEAGFKWFNIGVPGGEIEETIENIDINALDTVGEENLGG